MKLSLLRSVDLNNEQAFKRTLWIAPFLFGLVSLWLGADINWDLMNYHIYNPYAFFNNRTQIDLAPAGMQTYFNPTIDIPYYWMVNYLPAPMAGFVMGFFHGLNFVLLALIARKVLPDLPESQQYKFPLLIALFGCLTANFLAQMGNTMGDATTAVFNLSAVLIIVSKAPTLAEKKRQDFLWILAAGVLAGFAAGLKLTNVVYSTALCLSLFVFPIHWLMRFVVAFVFGVGVLSGIACTAGHWFWHLWSQFGNPLFPQFGNLFPHPLIVSGGVLDVAWRPKTLLENFIWPYIVSFKPFRVGEIKQIQIIWAVVYSLLLIWLLAWLALRKKLAEKNPLLPAARFVLAFVIVGFTVWMKVFGIQRYLVAIEICTPMVILLILSRFFEAEQARKYAVRALVFMSAIVVLISRQTWSHAPWATNMFSVEQPPVVTPSTATVLTIGSGYPHGWITTLLPSQLAFAQVGGDNPYNTANYVRRMHDITQSRGGEIYVMFKREVKASKSERVRKFNVAAEEYGLLNTEWRCRAVRWLLFKTRASVQVKYIKLENGGYTCEGTLLGRDDSDVTSVNQHYIAQMVERVKASGYNLKAESCATFSAYIGKKEFPMYWCKAEDLIVAQ